MKSLQIGKDDEEFVKKKKEENVLRACLPLAPSSQNGHSSPNLHVLHVI